MTQSEKGSHAFLHRASHYGNQCKLLAARNTALVGGKMSAVQKFGIRQRWLADGLSVSVMKHSSSGGSRHCCYTINGN